MRVIEMVRWHHSRIEESQSTHQQPSSTEQIEHRLSKGATSCLRNQAQSLVELYQIVKELVGGICQWVLKRVTKGPGRQDDGHSPGRKGLENSWVKKIQQILMAQYEGQFALVNVVDYAEIIHYSQKIQEKFALAKIW